MANPTTTLESTLESRMLHNGFSGYYDIMEYVQLGGYQTMLELWTDSENVDDMRYHTMVTVATHWQGLSAAGLDPSVLRGLAAKWVREIDLGKGVTIESLLEDEEEYLSLIRAVESCDESDLPSQDSIDPIRGDLDRISEEARIAAYQLADPSASSAAADIHDRLMRISHWSAAARGDYVRAARDGVTRAIAEQLYDVLPLEIIRTWDQYIAECERRRRQS